MANEAILLVQGGLPINFTVADGTGIEKGAILEMTDPRTAVLGTTQNAKVAGIAAVEKIAGDGVTQLAVYRDGIFKVKLSGSANIGEPLGIWGTATYPNYVYSLVSIASQLSGSGIVGYAMETAANGETLRMQLNPGYGAGAN